MPISLKQLEALVAIADEGSFRRAALLLGTTQPNVSHRIASLEEALGLRLMRRDAGSVRLTVRGETILAHARTVLKDRDALLIEAGRQDALQGRLKLGVTELVAATWLRAFLRDFRADLPTIAVEIEIGLAEEVERSLEDGTCNLALLAGVDPAPGDLDLGVAPYAWVAAPDLARALGPAPSLADLVARSILTHARRTAAVRALTARCAAEGLPADRIVCASTVGICAQMAEDGTGVALVPQAIARAGLASGRLRAVVAPWVPDPLRVTARPAQGHIPSFTAAAMELAKRAARDDQIS